MINYLYVAQYDPKKFKADYRYIVDKDLKLTNATVTFEVISQDAETAENILIDTLCDYSHKHNLIFNKDDIVLRERKQNSCYAVSLYLQTENLFS